MARSLREALSMKSAISPTPGEIYHVTGVTCRTVLDTINGGDRLCVILETDKGNIFAPSAIANGYEETAKTEGENVAQEMLVGADLRCVQYFSKKFRKQCTTLELA